MFRNDNKKTHWEKMLSVLQCECHKRRSIVSDLNGCVHGNVELKFTSFFRFSSCSFSIIYYMLSDYYVSRWTEFANQSVTTTTTMNTVNCKSEKCVEPGTRHQIKEKWSAANIICCYSTATAAELCTRPIASHSRTTEMYFSEIRRRSMNDKIMYETALCPVYRRVIANTRTFPPPHSLCPPCYCQWIREYIYSILVYKKKKKTWAR